MRSRLLAGAVALVAALWIAYATRFQYITSRGDVIRVNRYSGAAAVLTPDGWREAHPNPLRGLADSIP